MIIQVKTPNSSVEFWEITTTQFDILERLKEIRGLAPETTIEEVHVLHMY